MKVLLRVLVNTEALTDPSWQLRAESLPRNALSGRELPSTRSHLPVGAWPPSLQLGHSWSSIWAAEHSLSMGPTGRGLCCQLHPSSLVPSAYLTSVMAYFHQVSSWRTTPQYASCMCISRSQSASQGTQPTKTVNSSTWENRTLGNTWPTLT